jgi:hypothetical protein
MKLSTLKIILYILIPFAPLYARMVDLNGSLDHAWTMFPLFNIPPFSIVPVLMMAFGVIKKGSGIKPYDNFMWIPIVFRFIFSIILSLIIQNPILRTIFVLFLSISSIMLGNLLRRHENCKNRKDKNKTISYSVLDGKQWYRSFCDSIMELGMGEILPFLVTFIPFAGIMFKIIGVLPLIGGFVNDIIWSLGFATAYLVVNMYNQDNMNDLCYPNNYNTKMDIIKLIIGFILVLIGMVFSVKQKI